MHLVAGFFCILIAQLLAAIYRVLRMDAIARLAIRACYVAFFAGAGLDDAAIEILQAMEPDATRLLSADAAVAGDGSLAALILKMLQRRQHR